MPLTLWWEACGFDKASAFGRITAAKATCRTCPTLLLATNDPARLRCLRTRSVRSRRNGHARRPVLDTAIECFAEEVQTLLLMLGIPTSTKTEISGWGQSDIFCTRLPNTAYTQRSTEVGRVHRRTQAAAVRLAPIWQGTQAR